MRTAILALLLVAASASASAATLDRVKETGHLRLGYLTNARPLTFRGGESGSPDGYGIALCQRIVEAVKTRLGQGQIEVQWVPVELGRHLAEIQQGNIDLLCTPTAETVARREQVSYSIPVFPAGLRAVLRNDASTALRDALSQKPSTSPVWRGSPAARLLQQTTFAVVSGTVWESWVAEKRKSLQIDARIVPVPDHRAGLQALVDGKADVFFADRALALGAMDDTISKEVFVFDRLYTRDPLFLALAREDADFRLLVDRTLSESYSSAEFASLYAKWCGPFDEDTRAFFEWVTLMP